MSGQYIEAVSWPNLKLLPAPCEVCRRWCAGALCEECVSRFAPLAPRCVRCALRVGVAGSTCGNCLREPPPFEHTLCVADYGFPWDRLIADFKFHGRAELAAPLAALWQRVLPAPAAPELVLPVPLSARRLAERGYNQAWELARRAARAWHRPARADLLLRPLESLHQAELSRAARLANLRAAFIVPPRARALLAGRRLALIDDVLTTGATAREAARTLLQAGAGAVDVWVLARTP